MSKCYYIFQIVNRYTTVNLYNYLCVIRSNKCVKLYVIFNSVYDVLLDLIVTSISIGCYG